MRERALSHLFVFLIVAVPMTAAAPAAWADDEIPFEVANVFFELNDTDGDPGIHALIDGGPWKTLAIETPDEREILQIRLRSKLRRQGLTELFFESAEPTFDELSPGRFFRRFPEGEYEVEGTALDGQELESASIVSHLMPAPAGNLSVNGIAVPEDCDEGPVPAVSEPLVFTWDAVTMSHPDLGRTNEPIEVVLYQLVVEREEPAGFEVTFNLPPDVTSVELPVGFASSGDEFKVEVLVREMSGNQTATESCFTTGAWSPDHRRWFQRPYLAGHARQPSAKRKRGARSLDGPGRSTGGRRRGGTVAGDCRAGRPKRTRTC